MIRDATHPDFTGHAMHRDFAQVLAAAWPGHALATAQLETCAMHRADQQAFLAAQELARRPIQPTSCVRADIQPSTHSAFGIEMNDQRFRVAVNHGRDFMQAIRSQPIETQQRLIRGVETIII